MRKQIFCGAFTKEIFFATMTILLGVPAVGALGREWNINGAKVDAKLIDYNGSQVLLADRPGDRKAIGLNELGNDDLDYVQKLVEMRQAAANQKMQRIETLSLISDVWNVTLVARNGITLSEKAATTAIAPIRSLHPHADVQPALAMLAKSTTSLAASS